MKTTRSDEDLKLRELLRRGDPAQDHGLLGPQDLARMRQAMLTTIEERESDTRLGGWRWAAAVGLVWVLIAVGWSLRGVPIDRSATPEASGSRASSAPREDLPREVGPPEAAQAQPAPAPSATVVLERDEEAPPPVVVASSDDLGAVPETSGKTSDENLQARTLRFTTRRGTQIIWILDPALEL